MSPPHHDDDACRGERQRHRAEKPAEIAERKEKRALAAIEVPAGIFADPRRALDEIPRAPGVPLLGLRGGADQDGDVVVEPVRPGELKNA